MEFKMVLLWCAVVLQQTCALYIPSRYRFPLRMVRPSSTFYTSSLEGQYEVPAILEYFGKDELTHTVTRTEESAGENMLRAALAKNKKSKNDVSPPSKNLDLTDSATSTKSATGKKTDITSNHHEEHHRVAKNTDIVVSSLMVRDSNGNLQKKYIVMRNNKRVFTEKVKPKTKVHNWWG